MKVDNFAIVFKALSHPIRLRILELLRAQGSAYVGVMASRLEISRSHLSFHLKTLVDAELIYPSRDGRCLDYQVDKIGFAQAMRYIGRFDHD